MRHFFGVFKKPGSIQILPGLFFYKKIQTVNKQKRGFLFLKFSITV